MEELVDERPNILDTKEWTSQENVRSWIDNLTESELVSRASEASSPTKSSFESDVFLQLPYGFENDDLILGAEARYFGFNNHSIISPRLSPLISHEDNASIEYQESYTSIEHNEFNQRDTENDIVHKLEKHFASLNESRESVDENKDDFQEHKSKRPKLAHVSSESSWASSFDHPSSLAAALLPDPEEILYSLGFCDTSSTLQFIPSRFFQTPSDAYGINVDEIHHSLLLEHQESLSSYESSRHIIQRFSESSIELNSYTSSESTYLNAKNKRVLFQSSRKDMPSIHLSQEDSDRPVSPLSGTTSGSSNWMRLETLEELPEPSSRNSSFESDRLTNLTIAAFLAASKKANLNSDDEGSSSSRRYSSNSRGDTLTDENTNDGSDDNIATKLVEENQDALNGNYLHMPVTYKRSISDKSISSSVVTVVDADPSTSFKPITNAQNRELELCKQGVDACDAGSDAKSTPSLRRLSFKMTRSKKVDSDENIDDSTQDTNVSTSSDSITTNSNGDKRDFDEIAPIPNAESASTTQDTRRKSSKSLNDSLREFFRKLKKDVPEDQPDSTKEAIQESPCIQIVLTPPEPALDESVLLGMDRQSNENAPRTESKSVKKGYFSAAINSISHAISKYHDSKQTNCDHDSKQTKCDHDSKQTKCDHDSKQANNGKKVIQEGAQRESINQAKPKTPLFRIFNHQTLPVHSNSAFSAFASGVVDGRLDIELSEENNNDTTGENEDDLIPTHASGQFEEQFLMSDYSFEKTRESPLGYMADSPSSDDCACPVASTTTKKRKLTTKRLSKGHSFESSGFEEDHQTIKCPVDNCYIRHVKGTKHGFLTSTTRSESGIGKSPRNDTSSPSDRNMLMTHAHYDFLIQQFTSLRTEMREGFSRMEGKANHLETNFTGEIQKAKEVVVNTHMEWLLKEVDSLRRKLQEKDDEIERLHKVINSCQSSN